MPSQLLLAQHEKKKEILFRTLTEAKKNLISNIFANLFWRQNVRSTFFIWNFFLSGVSQKSLDFFF